MHQNKRKIGGDSTSSRSQQLPNEGIAIAPGLLPGEGSDRPGSNHESKNAMLDTSGRNQYYGPGLSNYNFALAKVFPLHTERVRLRFRADFFNLFNHTNFANPVSNQSSGNFGKIIATVGSSVATAVGTTAGVVGGGPRVIQGALRVEF
jgi:hypothetical protein